MFLDFYASQTAESFEMTPPLFKQNYGAASVGAAA